MRQLRRENIPYYQRGSRNVTVSDYGKFDYLLGMERSHVTAMERQLGGDPEGKMRRLLDFTRHPRDIDDPWYTGDFVTAYRDIEAGCAALLDEMFPGSGEKKAIRKDTRWGVFFAAWRPKGARRDRNVWGRAAPP